MAPPYQKTPPLFYSLTLSLYHCPCMCIRLLSMRKHTRTETHLLGEVWTRPAPHGSTPGAVTQGKGDASRSTSEPQGERMLVGATM